MITREEIESILHSLRVDIESESIDGAIRRLIEPSAAVDIFLGVAGANRDIGVLLRLESSILENSLIPVATRGFAIESKTFPEDGSDLANIGIFCVDHNFEQIFVPFIEDLLEHVLPSKNGKIAAIRFFERISLWQRFFVPGATGMLSPEEQRGLFTELYVLKNLILPRLGPSFSIAVWKGPAGYPQDFVLPHCALEIKSSSAKASDKIAIANELQLDNRPYTHLGLGFFRVSQGDSDGPSLTSMVQMIRELVVMDPLALMEFEKCLLQCGWLDVFSEAYSKEGIFIREAQWFQVKEGFPRIIRENFPSGVGDVRYTVEIGSAMSFLIDQSIIEQWIVA